MAATQTIQLQRLHSPHDLAFNDLLALYEDVFPHSERKPPGVLRAMLAASEYHFLVATEQGETIGFAIVRMLNAGEVALLEYMAIASVYRGRGLGGRMLRKVMEAVDAPARTLLLEVESDRTEGTDSPQSRRKMFYRSMGARELKDLSWIMPPVVAAPPPPMEILAFTAVNAVNKLQLRQWLTSIYVEVYEQRPDDPRIEQMMAELPEEVRLL